MLTAITLSLPDAYDLDRTLAVLTMGTGNPCLRHDDRRAQMALATPGGKVWLDAERTGDELIVRTHGDAGEWIEPHLPAVFGLLDDPAGFEPTGKLKRVAAGLEGLRLPRLPTVFQRLVQVVLQQLITFRDACRGWRQLVVRYGEPVPGADGLFFPPSAETLARLATSQYAECDILPRHARVIIALAKQAAGLERLWDAGLAPGAADKLTGYLIKQPGVGPWTVGYLRGAGLGDADAAVPGDYGHPKHVAYFFEGPTSDWQSADDERMLRLLEPFRPHRFRVLTTLIFGAPPPPRRGPKRGRLHQRMR